MATPVVGLIFASIGFVDLSIKLSGQINTFISDWRQSASDAKRISLQFDQLQLKLKSLQSLLFGKSRFTIKGKCLFEQLPLDEQTLIKSMLQELPFLLYEYWSSMKSFSLQQHSEDSSENQTLSSMELNTEELQILFESGLKLDRRTTQSSLPAIKALWWSVHKKKVVQKLVKDFGDWLERIKDCITSCWFPLSFMEHYDNLLTIEADEDCSNIGLTQAVGLRKLLVDDTILAPKHTYLSKEFPLDKLGASLRGLVDRKGDIFLVELLPYKPTKTGFIDETLKKRFHQIASLLKQQKDSEFRVLKCEGVFEYINFDSSSPLPQHAFALVSQAPKDRHTSKSLQQMYSEIPRMARPALEQRFELARLLSHSLALYHSVGWLHRNISSENVWYFAEEVSESEVPWHRLLLQPYLVGFEAARLADDYSIPTHNQNSFKRNVYRHPDRWSTPRLYFNQFHDIYALGVVLLEIGLWDDAPSIVKRVRSTASSKDPKSKTENTEAITVSRTLKKVASEVLGHRCGSVYQRLVLRCLDGDFDLDASGIDDGSGTLLRPKLQMAFRRLVVDELSRLTKGLGSI